MIQQTPPDWLKLEPDPAAPHLDLGPARLQPPTSPALIDARPNEFDTIIGADTGWPTLAGAACSMVPPMYVVDPFVAFGDPRAGGRRWCYWPDPVAGADPPRVVVFVEAVRGWFGTQHRCRTAASCADLAGRLNAEIDVDQATAQAIADSAPRSAP